MPITAIDLIVLKENNSILLAKRINHPAKNYFFVPGGRVYKNESREEALSRIFIEEIGSPYSCYKSKSIGIFDHFYSDSIWPQENISTHYIVEAILLYINSANIVFDLYKQHN